MFGLCLKKICILLLLDGFSIYLKYFKLIDSVTQVFYTLVDFLYCSINCWRRILKHPTIQNCPSLLSVPMILVLHELEFLSLLWLNNILLHISPHFIYPFICQWILGLLLPFGHWEYYYCGHVCTNISEPLISIIWGIYSEMELLDQKVILRHILRNHHTVFHSRSTILYSLQPCVFDLAAHYQVHSLLQQSW